MKSYCQNNQDTGQTIGQIIKKFGALQMWLGLCLVTVDGLPTISFLIGKNGNQTIQPCMDFANNKAPAVSEGILLAEHESEIFHHVRFSKKRE